MQERNPFDQFDEAPAGPQVVIPVSPLEQAKDQAQLQSAQMSAARTRQQMGLDTQRLNLDQQRFLADLAAKGLRVGANGQPEPIPGWTPPLSAANTPKITAKERSDAIAGYKSADNLDRIVAQLEQQFASGPGSTSGIAGLRDYLPTEANRRFDSTGNAARGIVGTALGFTGGQLNTATEAAMAVGPYLPQAGDRDEVIRDKIERLRQLANDARTRSVAILGGVPDANGSITPVNTRAPAAVPQEPDKEIATGQYKFESSDVASRMAMEMQRAGRSNDQINAALKAAGFSVLSNDSLDATREYLRQNPNFNGIIPGAGTYRETTGFNRFTGSPVGAAVTNYADAASGGAASLLAGQEARDLLQVNNAANPTSAFLGGGLGSLTAGLGAGKVLGMTRLAPWAASNPVAASLLGDAAYGGVYGANTADDGQGLTGAATGALGGIVGNRLGAGLSRAAGGAMRGVVDPSVQYLRQRGIPLTGGQIAGGWVKNAEDKLTSVPGVGNLIGDARSEGLKNFGQAAFDEAGDTIGFSPHRTGAAGVDDLLSASGRAYDNSTAGVMSPVDGQYGIDMAAVRAAAGKLPADLAQKAELALANRVDPVTATGQVSGVDYQQAFRGLKGYKAEATKPGFEQDYRNVLTGAQTALTDMMKRNGGGQVVEGLANADKSYRMAKVLEDAVKRARNGSRSGEVETFTPSQLTDAAVANRFSGNGTSRPFYELSTHGQRVLPSTVPDSGTPGRLALAGLATLGVPGVGVGIDYVTPGDGNGAAATGMGTLATLALLNTKAGRKAAEKALLERPDFLRQWGQKAITNSGRGGLFGRGVGVTGAGLLAN